MLGVIEGECGLHHAGVDGDVVFEEEESIGVVRSVVDGVPGDAFHFGVTAGRAGADDDGGFDASVSERLNGLITKSAGVASADVTDHDCDGASHDATVPH